MKKSNPLKPKLPLVPIAVNELVRAMKAELEANYQTLARYSGPAFTTIHGWAEGAPATQIEALFKLLARLSRAARHRIIDAACPCCPSLTHPYISRDRMTAAYLRRLLKQASGVTFVVAESDYLRTFVATALAHSFAAQQPNRWVVAGYDVHKPDWFTPVDGITCLDVRQRPESLERSFRGRKLERAPLILLNGLYSGLPALRTEAQKASAQCHVIVAEQRVPVTDLARFSTPKHVLTLTVDRNLEDVKDDGARMLIDVREATAERLDSRSG